MRNRHDMSDDFEAKFEVPMDVIPQSCPLVVDMITECIMCKFFIGDEAMTATLCILVALLNLLRLLEISSPFCVWFSSARTWKDHIRLNFKCLKLLRLARRISE